MPPTYLYPDSLYYLGEVTFLRWLVEWISWQYDLFYNKLTVNEFEYGVGGWEEELITSHSPISTVSVGLLWLKYKGRLLHGT